MDTERARGGGAPRLPRWEFNHTINRLSHSSTRGDETAPAPSLHSEDRSDGMMTREGMVTEGIAGEVAAARTGEPALPVRGSGGGL